MDRVDGIAELEDTLKQRDRRIEELKADLDKALKLNTEMFEHVRDVKDVLIESWIEGFDMEVGDNGDYHWPNWVKDHHALQEAFHALRSKWNKFVPLYNNVVAPRHRNMGRPLQASEAQQADALKRRKAGQSLRDIADFTGLTMRTVRTIIDKADGVDRATVARLQRIAPDKVAEARERSRRRTRDGLPRRITEALKESADLLKAAKGLR